MGLYDDHVCDTPTLIEALRASEKLQLNRRLDKESYRNLDPNRNHLICPQFPHEKAGGVETVLHVRCAVTMAVIGKEDGETMALDLLPEYIERMPTFAEVKATA